MSREVASDALCTITAVTFYPHDGGHGSCIGELRTDLAESLGIHSAAILEQAEEARAARSRVLLDVRTSKAWHRYVHGIKVLDPSVNPTPCLRCGSPADKADATPDLPAHFQCRQCHALWFLAPVTRAYGD